MVRVTAPIHIAADGRVVDETDPEVAVMLFGVGAEITDADAERYRLASPSGKAKSASPHTKAVTHKRTK